MVGDMIPKFQWPPQMKTGAAIPDNTSIFIFLKFEPALKFEKSIFILLTDSNSSLDLLFLSDSVKLLKNWQQMMEAMPFISTGKNWSCRTHTIYPNVKKNFQDTVNLGDLNHRFDLEWLMTFHFQVNAVYEKSILERNFGQRKTMIHSLPYDILSALWKWDKSPRSYNK